jgi:hypothetical protein
MVLPVLAEPGLLKGQFSYPFNFMLPAHCLESIWLKEGSYWGANKMEAAVVYKVKCKIVTSGLKSNIKSEQIFSVRDPPPMSIQQIYCEESRPIRKCLCCGKGDMHIKLTLNKNAFHVGESAIASVTLNNESDSDVDNIKFRLTRHVILSATIGTRRHDTQIISETVHEGGGIINRIFFQV